MNSFLSLFYTAFYIQDFTRLRNVSLFLDNEEPSCNVRFNPCDSACLPDAVIRHCVPDAVCQMLCARRCLPDAVCQMLCARRCLPDAVCQTLSARRCIRLHKFLAQTHSRFTPRVKASQRLLLDRTLGFFIAVAVQLV